MHKYDRLFLKLLFYVLKDFELNICQRLRRIWMFAFKLKTIDLNMEVFKYILID